MKWEDVEIPEKDPLLELWQGENLENWFYLTRPFLAVWKAIVMSNAFDSFQLSCLDLCKQFQRALFLWQPSIPFFGCLF
jgi:hypothetical protein